jgi:galactose-1-phosphate uridylyltransferase
LAKQVLPVLIGVEVKKRTMEALSDEQLDAVITQLRERNKELSEEEVAQVIRQALEEVRAAGCT